MRAPFPVTVSVGRSRHLGAALCAIWTLGLLLWFLWVFESGWREWRVALHGVLVLLTAGVFGWLWLHLPTGILAWDGERWTWLADRAVPGAELSGRVEVCLDWQSGQLLRLVASGKVLWLWLDRSMDAERWDDLRRATTAAREAAEASGRSSGMQRP